MSTNRQVFAFLLLACALVLLFIALARADGCGRIVAVHDGDTAYLRQGTSTIKFRFANIDAPESGFPYHPQPYGKEATAVLRSLILGKQVCTTQVDYDSKYHRPVLDVKLGDMDVNEEMVRRGAAWVYKEYNHDQALPQIENEAHAAHRGFWGLPDYPIYPAEWRKSHHY